MANALICSYSLPSVNINFSVELFPPKHKHALISVITEYVTTHRCIEFKFVSLTCGAGGADKHNSYKLLLALNSVVASPKLLVHLIQVDKSFKTLYTYLCALRGLGVSKVLLLKGDYYINSQNRLDTVNAVRVLRKIRRLSLFCVSTSYPETHNLSSSSHCERRCALIKGALGCSYSITQFFNVVSVFVKSSNRLCLLSELWNIPGFVISVKRPLGLRASIKCGVYVHSFVRGLLISTNKQCYIKRAMIVYTLSKLYYMLANNIRWLHVFTLNRFRTFRKVTWLFSLKEISLE